MDERELALAHLSLRAGFRSRILSSSGLEEALDLFRKEIGELLERERALIEESRKVIDTDSEIKWTWYWDSDYPNRLKTVADPPVVLFYLGDLSRARGDKALAIVGSRRSTSYGRAVAEELVRGLKGLDVVVVSGGAIGIDSVAHHQAVKEGIPTIVVLGGGVGRPYPASNVNLFREIVEQGGLVVSEFVPALKANRYTFPIRNRIISGLSDVVVVVEAGKRSGALITARYGAEQGREVYAVPGAINWPMSQGTNRLIKDGAMVLVSVEDFFLDLGWKGDEDLEKDLRLSETERSIIEIIRRDVRWSLEDLLLELNGIPREKVLAYISLLEIKGFLRREGGYVCPN